MPLDKDNQSHRNASNNLDAAFAYGNPNSGWRWTGVPQVYSGVARPIIHGVYHASRGASSGNPEEWARAKDQFSKVIEHSIALKELSPKTLTINLHLYLSLERVRLKLSI